MSNFSTEQTKSPRGESADIISGYRSNVGFIAKKINNWNVTDQLDSEDLVSAIGSVEMTTKSPL